MRSNEIEWIIDEDGFEWFSDNGSRYNVQVAKQIIIGRPREIVWVPTHDFVAELEPDEQDHTIDLEIPVILATKQKDLKASALAKLSAEEIEALQELGLD